MNVSVIDSSKVKVESFDPIQFQELLSMQASEDISIAIIKLNGTNRKIKQRRSNVYYFVLEGEGIFTIEGVEYKVMKHTLIAIPRGTIYFDSGNMTVFSICYPRFDAATVEYLEE